MKQVRRFVLGCALTATLTAPNHAAQFVTYESITVAATAIGISDLILTPLGVPQMSACSGRLETAQIRYRFDGTAPTSSEGQLLEIGDTFVIDNPADADRILFIRTGGTSGVLKVHCWR
jgi:hypothetical protein